MRAMRRDPADDQWTYWKNRRKARELALDKDFTQDVRECGWYEEVVALARGKRIRILRRNGIMDRNAVVCMFTNYLQDHWLYYQIIDML